MINHDMEHFTVREMNIVKRMGLIDNEGNVNDELVYNMLLGKS